MNMINAISYAEHVCNIGPSLWNLGKEGKEQRMTEHQQYHKTTSVKTEDDDMY
jgi:hypothetical protein